MSKKCAQCDCPMLPRNQKRKNDDEYRHASGCPLDDFTAAEMKEVETLRRDIEKRYEHVALGSGSIGGTFGEILCHELHIGNDQHPDGKHFGVLTYEWGISLHILGLLIADHCDKLPEGLYAEQIAAIADADLREGKSS